MRHPTSSVRAVGVLLVASAVIGAWTAAGSTRPPAQTRVGTIKASIDGVAKTWYALEGMVGGQLEPGAMWLDMSEGRRIVAVGGYDRLDVPFEEFKRNPQSGMVISYGGFTGDLVTVSFPVAADARAPLSFTVTPGHEASVVYVPAMDFDGMFSLHSGRIQVETIDWKDGRFSGTFEGELKSADGTRTARITDGSFEVRGARSLAEIRSRDR